MIDRKSLLSGLRRELKRLEVDLAEQAKSDAGMKFALEAEYRTAREAERIGESFNAWRGGVLTQAAVAWLLGCVFVRFAEDNGLVDEALLAGPGERNMRAADRQTLYFRAHPTDSDRDYLLEVFGAVSKPARNGPGSTIANTTRYGAIQSPAMQHAICWSSGERKTRTRACSVTTSPTRNGIPAFLGDLYQDLSDDAKKRFALLQTPEFVEEFILDRTLTPALDEFGLPGHPTHRSRLRLRSLSPRRVRAVAASLVRPRAGHTRASARAARLGRRLRCRHQPVRCRHRPLSPAGGRASRERQS